MGRSRSGLSLELLLLKHDGLLPSQGSMSWDNWSDKHGSQGMARTTSAGRSHARGTSPESDFDPAGDTLLDGSEVSLEWEPRPRLVPGTVRRFCRAAWRGPRVPLDAEPRAWAAVLPLELVPRKLHGLFPYKVKVAAVAVYLLLWALVWTQITLPYMTATPVDGQGQPVLVLTCGQADDFWLGKNAACGLDAELCPRFAETHDVTIRCPSLCDRGSWLYSMRAVGSELVKYRGYFIGGGPSEGSGDVLTEPYRGDSFPCGAAVHAGLVSPFFGGCARVSFTGPQAGFAAAAGHYGVSPLVGFPGWFPHLYVFKRLTGLASHCHDTRLVVLVLNLVMSVPVVFLASGACMYWVLSAVGFWTIVLATDPPVNVDPYDLESWYTLISLGLERFLPTCFVLYVLWTVSVRRTLDYVPQSPMSRVVFWFPTFWLGVLNNISFDRLPVDRLTWHDLQTQPGALVTISVAALVLVVCIVAQAYYVWLLGRFWKLLLVYGGMFAGLFLLAQLPGLTLRIHHYVFALMFIPGCGTRNRTGLAFQGILLGLFLSGVARWGYAAIAETNLSLLRGEPDGRVPPPMMVAFNEGLLNWAHSDAFPEVSLLVNDVERFRGPANGTLNVTTMIPEALGEAEVYFRLAQISEEKRISDYTRAAVLRVPSYEFRLPPPGIT